MIGTQADAQRAAQGFLDPLSYDGSSRIVYINDDHTIVYKVPIEAAWVDNIDEYENFLQFKDSMVKPLALPETNLFWVECGDGDPLPVIAMEFIAGIPLSECYCGIGGVCDEDECYCGLCDVCDVTCLPEDIKNLAQNFIGDTGGANIIENGGLYYIIDIAS